MTWDVTAETLHRTVKLLLDSGKERTPGEARAFLESRILQVAVGREIGGDVAAQAALLTVINAGQRAFLGGVVVHLEEDPFLSIPWAAGLSLSETVVRSGGQIVDDLDSARPTLAIARPGQSVGAPVLHVTHRGWVGGVVENRDALLEGAGIAPAGIAAGALGVSEAFQQELGDPVPGRRDVGVSLWRPDLHWRDPRAIGGELHYLPTSLWLLGLGHLGQAYCWVLGMLPYANPSDVCLGIVDYDRVVEGNLATQLLVRPEDIGRRKTRVISNALEALGFATVIVERSFDENFHPNIRKSEPTIAMAGFDTRDPRLLLGDNRFDWAVDGGLGTGAVEYLDIAVNTFPSPQDPAAAFPSAHPRQTPLPGAYEAEIARQIEGGTGDEAVRCGMLAIAGVNIGAAFVGAFAATIVVSDVLRLLHGGEPFSVVHVDLRHPENLRAVPNTAPSAPTPAYTNAR